MADYLIPNLANACSIMKLLSDHDNGLTAVQIENELDLPRTTVFRILKTLCHEGMAKKIDRLYFAGNNLIDIGLKLVSTNKLRIRAMPVLYELSRVTGFSAHLAVPSGYNSLILEVCDSPRPLRVASRQGTLASLNCSSTGKIFLAHLFMDKIEEIYEKVGFEARTRFTIVEVEAMKEELKRIIARGYSVDDKEFAEEVRCLAAPIYDYHGSAIAAIGITAPSSMFSQDMIPTIAKEVKDAGRRLYYNAGLNFEAKD